MLGTQQHATAGSRWQQAGFNLGARCKRAGNWWAGIEKRLVQQAGDQGQMMKAGLLLFKVALVVAAIIIGLFALYWVAIIVCLVAAIAFCGERQNNKAFEGGVVDKDGFRSGLEGFGYYMGGTRIDIDED